MARIHIAPNDRVAIVGATGSGKTFLSQHLTARAKRLVVADPKGTLYGRWGLVEWTRRSSHALAEGDEVRVRVQAPIIDRSEPPDWEPFLWDVYDAGHAMLYVDEVYGVTTKGGRSQALNAIYTRGRELQIGAIACSQRPSWIPLELLSESSWFFCFRLLLDEDRKRMAGLMGPNVLNGIGPGDPYGFYVYHVSWAEAIYVPQLEVPTTSERDGGVLMDEMLEFGNIYPSVDWALVGIMAVTFIAVFKFLLAKYPVPGLTDLIASI